MQPSDDRQSFLGPGLADATALARIAVVGISGGGSHVVQQLAHVGFRDFALFDPKRMEAKHLPRFVGATQADVDAGTPKVRIGERVIRAVRPGAVVSAIEKNWGEAQELLRSCDLVIGCVDTYKARHELEVATRRYLIPYIDIGMDVLPPGGEYGHRIVGQVILSMPGGPCMRCMRFLHEELLAQEAQEYGAAGGAPQVIFANGILASAAVSMAVDLMTGWNSGDLCPYLRLDGNGLMLAPDPCEDSWRSTPCTHFRDADVGPPQRIHELAPRSRVKTMPPSAQHTADRVESSASDSHRSPIADSGK